MKLPNGFGSCYKLSGNRRKPFAARKTTGWTFNEETGKSFPVYEFIGFFATRKEALTALVEYNKDPYDLNADRITFAEVFDRWSEQHFKGISESNIKGVNASYKICDPIKDMVFTDIKLSHLQSVVDQSGKNSPTLKKVKSMLHMMWEFAIRNEITKKDPTEHLDISRVGNPDAIDRSPFTRDEIQTLWDNASKGYKYRIPLILIYTGLRIGELYNLRKEDVHLEERYFHVTASKTDSGIRDVPIADKILPFFEDQGSEWMFPTLSGGKHQDKAFRECYWNPVMDDLLMTHRPHDTRHTCISLLTEAGVDERIIKQIVGHKGAGVTQSVYTHIGMRVKLEAINRI